MILVSCPLNGDNYPTWRRVMINALCAKKNLGLVDGSIMRPQSSSPDGAAWLKCNSMVISWLFNSLVPDLHDSVAYADTAQEMWADLEERFCQGNAPRVHELKRDLALMRQDRLSVAAYYTKMKGIWDALSNYSTIPQCTYGTAKEFILERDKEKVHQFLMGLTDAFHMIHLAGKATHPCLSVTDWVVDSGASDHMTATESHLSHIQQASMSLPVNLPNGSSLPISNIGQATLSPNIFLDKVFYIPGFTCNLLSDLASRKLIGTGEMRNGIYYLKPLRPSFASPATRVLPRALWHQRLGHIFFHHLSLIPNISMSSLNKSNECCDVCHRAKQARLSFPIRYRVFNLTTKLIFTSRDVHFHETQFPFQMSSSYPISSAHPVVPLPVSDDPLSHPPSIDHTNTSPPSTEPNFDPTLVSTPVFLTEPPPCRPTHDRRCLAYLTDYVCPTLQVPTNSPSSLQEASLGNSSGNPYPLTNFVSYSRYNSPHMAFLTALTSHDEPKTYSQAVRDPRWREAMSKEITAFEHNNTWTLEPLPPGKKPIGCKWIYKVKYHSNGTIKRFKACLVAKGYTQVEGLDFHETYAPVAKLVTVRCLLAIAAVKHWELHQLDVHNAFLHGDLHEEVFMTVPPSFAKPGDNRLCRLRKSLYGLKQALRQWFAKFSTALLKFGFQQSTADHSLYTMHKDSAFLAVLVYVDDLIATGNDSTLCCSLKKYLDDCFHIKDLGSLKYFLGIEVARSPIGISLCQRKYTLDILNESDMLGAKPISFPMEQNHHLSIDTGAPVEDPAQYRRLVGRLIYLTITRPDITYSVHIFSQFMHDPHQGHLDVAMRVFRYLKSSPGQGIFLSSSSLPLGYFTQLGSSPLSWKTKKQVIVSRSSAKAEYRSMAATTSELLWLRSLLCTLGVSHPQPMLLYCDSQAALHIAANPVFHERMKHIEIDCHFVRERLQSHDLVTSFVPSHLQLADIFTKALGRQAFQSILNKLGIFDLHAPT
uniref:Reverse transcriptase Ty1/copia-type domain-containing protein n=1 Tax=Fagus sylvatica TaxID=28930 RepID=A0A2N9EIP0_FAGSY